MAAAQLRVLPSCSSCPQISKLAFVVLHVVGLIYQADTAIATAEAAVIDRGGAAPRRSTATQPGPAKAAEPAVAAIRQHAAALQAAFHNAGQGGALLPNSFSQSTQPCSVATAQRLCAASLRLAAALLDYWQQPEQAAAGQLEAAQVAAARSCAYLRCANLGGQGGPAAGQGEGSARCRWAVCISGLCLSPHADAHACRQTCNCCTLCRLPPSQHS